SVAAELGRDEVDEAAAAARRAALDRDLTAARALESELDLAEQQHAPRQAASLREQETALGQRLATAREHLTEAVSARTGAEAGLAGIERQLAQDARAAVVRAERLARLRGQVAA